MNSEKPRLWRGFSVLGVGLWFGVGSEGEALNEFIEGTQLVQSSGTILPFVAGITEATTRRHSA